MKKIILLYFLSILLAHQLYSQNNTGTPYSMFGIGLLQDNYGPYTAMGGVSAAMRDNNNINFLNPASYTALDSNRFYFQFGITGEYVNISTHQENSSYRVAQNASLNMAFRVYNNLFASLGFNQRSDIGYDLYYYKMINGSDNEYYNQQVSGEGGLNDFYLGFAYRFWNLSVGLNSSVVFGNIEKRETLTPLISDSYYINSRNKIAISDVIFNIGLQYDMKLSPKSKLTLGSAFNLSSKMNARKDLESYKINSSTQVNETLDDEKLNNGNISYPFRIISGFAYDYKDKWMVSGDYTFQEMSAYKEFGIDQEYNDYHKIAIGASLLPARYGRFWWQRNKYILGAYAVRSQIEVNNVHINTYGVTCGIQMPVYVSNRELSLGIAFDLGLRGTEKNGLIQEKYAKVRLNIAFKEGWFMKRKID
ncbi:outer membrane protein transport protein [Odoribacter lunatus]|uniref:outer membrane protein transport protein n=1 Tax=Odoribacter lunatus TaxID=2941335 RepID=UPI00203BE529|nr:outer membrane protein transport protein [Odoribacter lunatus]